MISRRHHIPVKPIEWPVTPKSVPPKIGPAGPTLAKNLPKVFRRTTFAAKISPAGPILAAKICPPLPISVPPLYYFLYYTIGTCIGSYSYS